MYMLGLVKNAHFFRIVVYLQSHKSIFPLFIYDSASQTLKMTQ